jgi:hypothetical protein
MPPGEFLDATELHQLTGYARCKQQATWLHAEGIPHQVRGRRVVVCRVHSRAWVEGKPSVVSLQEPDLSCVR